MRGLGKGGVKSGSRVPRILKRRENAPATPVEKAKEQVWRFFEAIAPHKIWQLDILYAPSSMRGNGSISSILDDHSGFVMHAKVMLCQRALDVVTGVRAAVEQHGIPEMLLVDNGRQFKSKRFRDVCQASGIELLHGLSSILDQADRGLI